jgi:hypothetical protein
MRVRFRFPKEGEAGSTRRPLPGKRFPEREAVSGKGHVMAGVKGMKRGQTVKAQHGIPATYQRGLCRDPEKCPGHPVTGITCSEARRIWRKERYDPEKRAAAYRRKCAEGRG